MCFGDNHQYIQKMLELSDDSFFFLTRFFISSKLYIVNCLLGAEDLATVATVVPSLVNGEANATVVTAVLRLVLEPVVCHTSAGLV